MNRSCRWERSRPGQTADWPLMLLWDQTQIIVWHKGNITWLGQKLRVNTYIPYLSALRWAVQMLINWSPRAHLSCFKVNQNYITSLCLGNCYPGNFITHTLTSWQHAPGMVNEPQTWWLRGKLIKIKCKESASLPYTNTEQLINRFFCLALNNVQQFLTGLICVSHCWSNMPAQCTVMTEMWVNVQTVRLVDSDFLETGSFVLFCSFF